MLSAHGRATGWSTGIALIANTVAATVFQVAILSAAAWAGGPEEAGRAALFNALATVVSAAILSDQKSLTTLLLASGHGIGGLNRIHGGATLLLAMIAAAGAVLFSAHLFAAFSCIRAIQGYSDKHTAYWQKLNAPRLLVLFSVGRYAIAGVMLYGAISLRAPVEAAMYLACLPMMLLLFLEYLMLRRKGIDREFNSDSEKTDKIIKQYLSLSISGFMNFFPQSVIRYWLLVYSSIEFVGIFSIQYQLLMIPVPIITAYSQMALGRERRSNNAFRNDLSIIFSLGLCFVLFASLITSTDIIRFFNILFPGFVPLDFASSVFLAVACILQFISVFAGFYSVKLGKYYAQIISGGAFLTLTWGLSIVFGSIGGGVGVVAAFMSAALARSAILLTITAIAEREQIRNGSHST